MRGESQQAEGEKWGRKIQRLLGNVEQPSLAKAQGQSKGMVGGKDKIVGFSYIVLCFGSEEWEIILVVNESH